VLGLLVSACASARSGGASSSVGPVSSLYFAVTGDSRPPTVDDTDGYPTQVVDTIFSDIAALRPQPAFVVSTGDYMFASPHGTEADSQLGLYLAARGRFPGPWFPAMGNHECNGFTESNCGVETRDGLTQNYQSFLELALAPIAEQLPYYTVRVNAVDGTWTSKLVFIAANAWSSAQADWLETTLAETTTYTFVVRHEPADATSAPGTSPSEAILRGKPVTLLLCGHTHSYSHQGNRVVVGNGGAPLTDGRQYGFVLVRQRSDRAIVVDEIDYESGAIDAQFHFVVTSTGDLIE
jgi:hypothetical protein